MLILFCGGGGLGLVLLLMLVVTRAQEQRERRVVERHFALVQQQLQLMQRAHSQKPTPPSTTAT